MVDENKGITAALPRFERLITPTDAPRTRAKTPITVLSCPSTEHLPEVILPFCSAPTSPALPSGTRGGGLCRSCYSMWYDCSRFLAPQSRAWARCGCPRNEEPSSWRGRRCGSRWPRSEWLLRQCQGVVSEHDGIRMKQQLACLLQIAVNYHGIGPN